MKTCTKCKESKEIKFFGKAKLGKDGLRAICKKCHNTETTQRNRDNPEKATAYGRKYREEKREQISASRAIHTAQNKESLTLYAEEYRKANPGKINAKTAKRRAARRKAVPKWLTKIQLQEMQNFYIFASLWSLLTGIPHEVDHIVPLQGKNVRGLHVPWNLRVITQEENRHKNNKMIS
jgi:5-methylcytosine-specific restriction endonuclease McrA